MVSRTKLAVEGLGVRYGEHTALSDVSFEVREHEIFGIIGPANAGKTSFLRCLNRMNELTDNMQVTGSVLFDGKAVNEWRNVYALRRRIGVVFPLPVRPSTPIVVPASSANPSSCNTGVASFSSA